MRIQLSGILSSALALVILFSYQNCSPVHEGNFADWNEQASTALPPFSPALATALTESCASCHAANVASPANFLTAMSLEAGPWVNLDDPESSLVLLSVLKEAPAPAQGMPQGETEPWESAELLRSWLQALKQTGPGDMLPPVDLGPATFSSVSGMIQEYCISCHGAADQYPLTNYDQVVSYVDTSGGASLGELYTNVANRSMPRMPVSMSDNVRESFQELLFEWITSGAPNN